jgi:hypothetical protein
MWFFDFLVDRLHASVRCLVASVFVVNNARQTVVVAWLCEALERRLVDVSYDAIM